MDAELLKRAQRKAAGLKASDAWTCLACVGLPGFGLISSEVVVPCVIIC